MGIMQKEIRDYKKSVAIIESIVVASFMIFTSGVIGDLRFNHLLVSKISDPIFFIITVGLVLFILNRCRSSYKYSVVGDQFFVHKMEGRKQELLADFRVSDILYIGNEKKEINKFNASSTKNYTCSLYDSKKFCCIYEENGMINKFYFEPSNQFVKNIENLKVNMSRYSVVR